MSLDIFQAAKSGTSDDLRLAIVATEDLDSLDKQGRTAMFYAAERGDTDKVQLLLEHGASPLPGRCTNALSVAASQGHKEIVQTIINAGYHPDATREKGDSTALMDACLNNHVELVKVLLDCGADPNYKSSDHLRPIDCTTGGPSQESFDILLPLTDRSYRKTAKKHLEQTIYLKAARERQYPPEKRAERDRRRQEVIKRFNQQESTLDRLLQGKITPSDIKALQEDSEDQETL